MIIDVPEEGNIIKQRYVVKVSGYNYETDHYNPWEHSYEFKTIGKAVRFKQMLDNLPWDGDTLAMSEVKLPDEFNTHIDRYETLEKTEYRIAYVEISASSHYLTKTEIRKATIKNIL